MYKLFWCRQVKDSSYGNLLPPRKARAEKRKTSGGRINEIGRKEEREERKEN